MFPRRCFRLAASPKSPVASSSTAEAPAADPAKQPQPMSVRSSSSKPPRPLDKQGSARDVTEAESGDTYTENTMVCSTRRHMQGRLLSAVSLDPTGTPPSRCRSFQSTSIELLLDEDIAPQPGDPTELRFHPGFAALGSRAVSVPSTTPTTVFITHRELPYDFTRSAPKLGGRASKMNRPDRSADDVGQLAADEAITREQHASGDGDEEMPPAKLLRHQQQIPASWHPWLYDDHNSTASAHASLLEPTAEESTTMKNQLDDPTPSAGSCGSLRRFFPRNLRNVKLLLERSPSDRDDDGGDGKETRGGQRPASTGLRPSSVRPHRRRRLPLQRSSAVVGYDVLYSPQLYRPMRYITRVESVTEDGYVRLNQYKIQQEIGMGSYGIVKLAYNERDNNLYAMKVLDKIRLTKKFACFRKPPPRRNKSSNATSVAQDPLSQVQREIAILRKLNHPNVVKLVEVLDDHSDRFLYMVFEYLERSAVMEIPTTEVLSESTAWRYFRDTILGLEYLHHQKIIHRDIKPSNLLLTDDEHVKIADFGVSSEFEGIDAFLTGTAGTPAFMAPESLTEDSVAFYSGRAQDIWSTGITLYAFVFGMVPFHDNYVIALYKKIKTDPLEFPDTPIISDALKNLIRGMLAKDPGLRMTLPEIKDHPWVTRSGTQPMPTEEQNCHLITVTDEEVRNSVRVIPRLDTLILIKTMGRNRSFGNPFRRRSANSRRRAYSRSPDPGIRRLEVLTIDDLENSQQKDAGSADSVGIKHASSRS